MKRYWKSNLASKAANSTESECAFKELTTCNLNIIESYIYPRKFDFLCQQKKQKSAT